MVTVHPQFIKDANGEKSMVILPINEFDAIMEELEDMEDVRLYDEAQKCNEPSIPIDEAFKMIEAKRKVQ
ncbi:MAG: hypothetical protein IPQ18_10550 [Saprospiraceae bacterium]|jgi:hypothetical protein|nr:hypothetical protein [Saprospiraceae bacterium]